MFHFELVQFDPKQYLRIRTTSVTILIVTDQIELMF